MPKGYWVGRVDVTNPDIYRNYLALNGKAFAKYGAKFLVRGGAFENPKGTARARNVVIEFASYEAALECWNSLEYQAALAAQKGGAEVDMVIIEGYDGVQPGA